MIHPLALVSPRARLGADVSIGPFAIIEDDVEIGNGCQLASHVIVHNGTTLGEHNQVFAGTVLGGLPQHVKPPERQGRLVIGSYNTLREHCTVHRAMREDATTTIGDHNFMMVGTHVAHDCRVGNRTIFANNALLAGHVTVEDRAFVSGAVAVHQFCRIGQLAMVGGHARIVQDVPPFVTVDGGSALIVGLNLVGLRRAGFSPEEITQLKEAYRVIYRRGLAWNEMLAQLQAEFPTGPAAVYHAFFSQGSRGFIQERRLPPRATLKLRRAADEAEGEQQLRAKAG